MSSLSKPTVSLVPPFTPETAILKVRAVEDNWNTRDPERVSHMSGMMIRGNGTGHTGMRIGNLTTRGFRGSATRVSMTCRFEKKSDFTGGRSAAGPTIIRV
jgi:hypothetical protein